MILEYEEALYKRKKRDDAITKRVQEHYQYLQSKGYDVVCTILQGSQNYGLDIIGLCVANSPEAIYLFYAIDSR